jgi:hypothetical protein
VPSPSKLVIALNKTRIVEFLLGCKALKLDSQSAGIQSAIAQYWRDTVGKINSLNDFECLKEKAQALSLPRDFSWRY